MLYITQGRGAGQETTADFFDMDFKLLDCKRKDYKLLNYSPKKPKTFEKIITED